MEKEVERLLALAIKAAKENLDMLEGDLKLISEGDGPTIDQVAYAIQDRKDWGEYLDVNGEFRDAMEKLLIAVTPSDEEDF